MGGIDDQGRVGALQRDGQSALSKACGAALGSYKAIQEQGDVAAPTSDVRDLAEIDNDPFDPELQTIISLLKPRLNGVAEAAEPITFVTYQMYTIVRDLIDKEVTLTPDVWDWVTEVAVVGGIMINRRKGGDFFQPLKFEIRTRTSRLRMSTWRRSAGGQTSSRSSDQLQLRRLFTTVASTLRRATLACDVQRS